jgi:hypothetical protein
MMTLSITFNWNHDESPNAQAQQQF